MYQRLGIYSLPCPLPCPTLGPFCRQWQPLGLNGPAAGPSGASDVWTVFVCLLSGFCVFRCVSLYSAYLSAYCLPVISYMSAYAVYMCQVA